MKGQIFRIGNGSGEVVLEGELLSRGLPLGEELLPGSAALFLDGENNQKRRDDEKEQARRNHPSSPAAWLLRRFFFPVHRCCRELDPTFLDGRNRAAVPNKIASREFFTWEPAIPRCMEEPGGCGPEWGVGTWIFPWAGRQDLLACAYGESEGGMDHGFDARVGKGDGPGPGATWLAGGWMRT